MGIHTAGQGNGMLIQQSTNNCGRNHKQVGHVVGCRYGKISDLVASVGGSSQKFYWDFHQEWMKEDPLLGMILIFLIQFQSCAQQTAQQNVDR